MSQSRSGSTSAICTESMCPALTTLAPAIRFRASTARFQSCQCSASISVLGTT
jgi:hypothetical protein